MPVWSLGSSAPHPAPACNLGKPQAALHPTCSLNISRKPHKPLGHGTAREQASVRAQAAGSTADSSALTGRRDGLHISGVPRVLWVGDSSQWGLQQCWRDPEGKLGQRGGVRGVCGVGFEGPRGRSKAERQKALVGREASI